MRAQPLGVFGPGDVDGPSKRARIASSFFGMGMERFLPTWPALDVGAARLSTHWGAVERSPGVYIWGSTDVQVSTAEAHRARPVLVLVDTPLFHGLGPAPTTSASPPDLRAYRAFVRALVSRYGDRVDYQVWNEPNVTLFYKGTTAHVARMTYLLNRAVLTIAPGAAVIAPSFVLRGESNYSRHWFKRYWTREVKGRPVSRLVDVASLSAYPMPEGDPEDGLAITQWARRIVTRVGFRGPLWATEINYGANAGEPTAPLPMRGEVSNVVRTYVLHAALGADRVFWYSWANDPTVNTHLQDGEGTLTPAGAAYGVVQDWLIGMRPTGCSATRGVTTCIFRGRGVRREISWTRSGRIRVIRAPEHARKRESPDGRRSRIRAGDVLRVGTTPIMVEVRRTR